MEKENRGGVRAGAGRKPKENARRETVAFVCTKAEKKMIDDASAALNMSRSEYICGMLFRGIN